jgi:hypothetical protein
MHNHCCCCCHGRCCFYAHRDRPWRCSH